MSVSSVCALSSCDLPSPFWPIFLSQFKEYYPLFVVHLGRLVMEWIVFDRMASMRKSNTESGEV